MLFLFCFLFSLCICGLIKLYYALINPGFFIIVTLPWIVKMLLDFYVTFTYSLMYHRLSSLVNTRCSSLCCLGKGVLKAVAMMSISRSAVYTNYGRFMYIISPGWPSFSRKSQSLTTYL